MLSRVVVLTILLLLIFSDSLSAPGTPILSIVPWTLLGIHVALTHHLEDEGFAANHVAPSIDHSTSINLDSDGPRVSLAINHGNSTVSATVLLDRLGHCTRNG